MLFNRVTGRVAHVEVQAVGVDNIVVDNLDLEIGLQDLHQLAQLGTSNTIGTVNGQGSLDLDAAHNLLERLRKLLVVALLRWLAILVLCSEGVLAADDVVELGSGHVLEVDELDLGGSQGGVQDAHEAGTGGTSVAGEDHTGGVGHLDIDLLHEFVVDISDGLQRGVGQLCRVSLPFGLDRVISLGTIYFVIISVLLRASHPVKSQKY